MSDSVTIGSIAEFIEFIDSIPPVVQQDPRTYESTFVFRGQGSVSYELLPSIARDCWWIEPCTGKRRSLCGSLYREADFVESACRMKPDIFKREMLPIDLLACLQHYGVPTRLLDVTTNALAALYFACGNERDDGEVFVFRRPDGDRREYPVCQAIADSWHLFMCSKALAGFASLAISRPYFDYQRSAVLQGYADSARQAEWFKECCSDPMFVYGTRYLDRQTAQSGEYILFPNDIRSVGDCMVFEDAISPLSKDSPVIAGRCVVAKDGKRAILKGLRRLGITEATLFPDSIEKVCADMARLIKS